MNDFFRLLENYPLFSHLIDNRFNRSNIDIYDLEKLESFIVNNRKDEKYIGIIRKYTSFIYKKFLENPYIIFDSRIFRYKIFEHYFGKTRLSEINNFRKKVELEYNSILNNINSYPIIDEKYLRYAISLIGRNSDITDRTYKFLLNNYNKYKSFFVDEFIIKYTAFLVGKELGISYDNVYYCDFDFTSSKVLDSSGGYSPKSRYVFVNSDMDKKSLIALLHTVSHEMKHRKQHIACINDEISLQQFYSLLRILINSDEAYINMNYDNDESEIDANNYSWDLICRIISKYFNDKKGLKEAFNNKNKYKYLLAEAVNFKYGKSLTEVIESDEYNVRELDKAIANNTKLLRESSILGYIYDVTGKREGFYSLLFNENALLKKDHKNYSKFKKIFRLFYIYDICKGKDISIEGLSEENQKLVINKLLELAIEELQDIINIKTLVKITKYPPIDRINSKNRIKIKRISILLSKLNKNISLITKFDDKLIRYKIKKLVFLIDKIKFNRDLNVINNIFYLKNTRGIKQSGYKLQKVLK